MICRFVEKKDIRFLKDGTSKCKLHLPTTRERSYRIVELLLQEAEAHKLFLDLFLGSSNANLTKFLHSPSNHSHLSVVAVKIMLNEDGFDFIFLRETFNLFVVDGTHEGRLSGPVRPAESVPISSFETKISLVEQDLSTIGQVECTVAKIFTLLIIRFHLILLGGTRGGTFAKSIDNTLGVSFANERDNIRFNVLSPGDGVVVF